MHVVYGGSLMLHLMRPCLVAPDPVCLPLTLGRQSLPAQSPLARALQASMVTSCLIPLVQASKYIYSKKPWTDNKAQFNIIGQFTQASVRSACMAAPGTPLLVCVRTRCTYMQDYTTVALAYTET